MLSVKTIKKNKKFASGFNLGNYEKSLKDFSYEKYIEDLVWFGHNKIR